MLFVHAAPSIDAPVMLGGLLAGSDPPAKSNVVTMKSAVGAASSCTSVSLATTFPTLCAGTVNVVLFGSMVRDDS